MFRIVFPNLRFLAKALSILSAALAALVLIATALPTCGAANHSQPSERPAASPTENEPEWSNPVGGLQCRLYLPPIDPKITQAEYALLFELRNADREPIVLPLASGAPVVLTLHVTDYPELQSANTHTGQQSEWQILDPGRVFSYRVTRDFIIAYGRFDGVQWQRFDPAGKTYEVTADFLSGVGQVTGPREGGGLESRKTVKVWTGNLSSNSIRLPLGQGPIESRYWPPRPPTAAPASEWSEPSNHGLQTRVVFLTEQPTAGKPIIGRIQLREKDGKDWAQNAIFMSYKGDLVLVGPDGKEIARQSYSLGFNTIVHAGRTLTLCQFDLDLKPFLLAKPGKYSVRFDGFSAGQMESKGAVDLPESPLLKFEVAPASWKPLEP
jgi:hypothetical protein